MYLIEPELREVGKSSKKRHKSANEDNKICLGRRKAFTQTFVKFIQPNWRFYSGINYGELAKLCASENCTLYELECLRSI